MREFDNCSCRYRAFWWPVLMLQLKRAGPGLPKQQTVLSNSCLTGSAWPWACHECHQFLQIFLYPLHLTFGYIGLQALDDQLFGLWLNLWNDVIGQVALHMKVWCAEVLFIRTGEYVNYSNCHSWSSNLWLVESFKDKTRLLSTQNLTFLS